MILEMEKLYQEKGKVDLEHHERQKKVITDVIEMIEQILKDLEIIPIDMVSENIRDVINKINELTGENVKEEVLNEIFKNFCLGK